MRTRHGPLSPLASTGRTFPRAELGAVLAAHQAEGDVEEARPRRIRPPGSLHQRKHVLKMLLLAPVHKVQGSRIATGGAPASGGDVGGGVQVAAPASLQQDKALLGRPRLHRATVLVAPKVHHAGAAAGLQHPQPLQLADSAGHCGRITAGERCNSHTQGQSTRTWRGGTVRLGPLTCSPRRGARGRAASPARRPPRIRCCRARHTRCATACRPARCLR